MELQDQKNDLDERFNSIKVQLERIVSFVASRAYSSFNSIKVQLEQFYSYSLCSLNTFQFHKGSIRTAIS